MKAIGLFSGGLDSILAVQLMKEQDIEVEVLHYEIGFESLHLQRRSRKKALEVTRVEIEEQLGVNILDVDVRADFLPIVFHPKHGYGAAMNPCIDCKAFIFSKAREYMETHQAHFVFTGEVIGQRPMSQQRPIMDHIEKVSGLQGYLLRPLSAKLLPPTIPEQCGWIDRERLLDISGRGRAVQTALADQYGFKYPQPGGGCLLTDQNFANRLRELMRHKPEDDIRPDDIALLKLGRHFRLSDRLKVIVGRHEIDNNILEQYVPGRWSATVREFGSPLTIIDGDPAPEHFECIAQIIVAFTKGKHAEAATVDFVRGAEYHTLRIVPDSNLQLHHWKIL